MISDATGTALPRCTLNSEGLITDVNEPFCALLGFSAQQVLHRAFDALSRTALPDEPRPALPDPFATRSHGEERRLSRADGTTVWVRVHREPVGDGVVVTLVDIGIEKELQQRAAAAEVEVLNLARFDALTGALSREAILAELADAFNVARASGLHFGLLLVSTGNLREVNGALSLSAGDAVLRAVARRLRRCMPLGSLIGRLDGTTALCLVPGTSAANAHVLSRRVIEAISDTPVVLSDQSVWVTVSVGAATSTMGDSAEAVLRSATTALVASRSRGAGVAVVGDGSAATVDPWRPSIGHVREALGSSQFTAWFQPQVRLSDNAVVAYEALARWRRPDLRVVEAADFIGIAERGGLISEIGRHVLRRAFLAAAQLGPGIRMAVNASPQELSRAGYAREYIAACTSAGVDPADTAVEVTEGSILAERNDVLATLVGLVEHGVGVHVDDFGTGYSSVAHLRDLPITGIKLDRSFTEGLLGPDAGRVRGIVAGLADLADRLGLERIAEGVATRSQERILAECGWDRGQGFLYCAALPVPA